MSDIEMSIISVVVYLAIVGAVIATGALRYRKEPRPDAHRPDAEAGRHQGSSSPDADDMG